MTTDQLAAILATFADLELAVIIGSQTNGTARPDSDWDIALQWSRSLTFTEQLAATEHLRNLVAKQLQAPQQSIDLIDLPTARLAMRAVVAEEGIVLKGGESLAWHRFLQRTWRELEEQYWEQLYAA
ncbi:MAG: nucleotidyltransferase domain-containing protein [Geobacter sp.]